MDNNITRFPDAYYKTAGGNLRNLLQIAFYTESIAMQDFEDIGLSRDLYEAKGKTLDYYGAALGVSRNGATDEQFLTKILNQISQNVSGSDTNSVIKSIALMLSVDPASVSIEEGNMTVRIHGLTIEAAEASGYTYEEIGTMIESILPIGVGLGSAIYNGTLLVSGTSPTEIMADYPVLFPAWYLSQREKVLRGKDVGLKGSGTVPDEFLAVGAGREPTDEEPWYENIGTDGMEATGTYSGGTLAILS